MSNDDARFRFRLRLMALAQEMRSARAAGRLMDYNKDRAQNGRWTRRRAPEWSSRPAM